MRLREEDAADKWLREHDPYYTSTNKRKSRKEKYPYEAPEMERQRKRKEICFSDLSLKNKKAISDVVDPFEGY